ncbi:DUF3581 family protein [Granulosicoccus antarcticus]|uniref:DUF3581 domain-containing protein n=1 Tax=Granulosicoccus antarcticus IMCC3135 TaxID=1192854 RepID=A0A2Z2NSC5_9GAMM|nr:DUF3581 family protein [Granulosicoccus antarcticus]ASJ72911.1 hypothetical protein IMCC3135_14130 [Granulosicoccus antarcticus IMCC3135]
MDIAQYFSESDGAVSFSEEQASAFAKGIAGDFNPIHDPQSKRFCVPGDLLFSVLLNRYGVAQKTRVRFSGMLDGSTRMLMPASIESDADITDAKDRALLSLSLEGPRFTDPTFIAQLSNEYVHFSGQTFPDILVRLMREADVMINPDRPLVIYRDMAIELNDSAVEMFLPAADGQSSISSDTSTSQLSLKLANTDLTANGRKGLVRLNFSIAVGETIIGTGEKNMVLSGLREYEESAMQQIVDQYNLRRESYTENKNAL